MTLVVAREATLRGKAWQSVSWLVSAEATKEATSRLQREGRTRANGGSKLAPTLASERVPPLAATGVNFCEGRFRIRGPLWQPKAWSAG